jgi:predicted Holliday junction resolvase-like endonuclease
MLIFLSLILITVLILLLFNRYELLKIIKERDSSISQANAILASYQEKISNFTLEVSLLNERLNETDKELYLEKEKNAKVVSQKKSSETKLGAIAENALPLLQNIPYNPQNLRHLGMPIDFVYFDYDGADPGIIFIEVKSGKAKESSRQKLIKKLITEGKVYYEELRINEHGIKIKRADPNK